MTITLQKRTVSGVKCWVPFDQESEEVWESYKPNQICTAPRISGTRKARSLKQNNTYFAACKFFFDQMSPDDRWQTAQSVDPWMRHALQYYDLTKTMVMPDGRIIFETLPLNFKGCEQADANKYYDRAFQLMADLISVDVDTFIDEVKRNMGV